MSRLRPTPRHARRWDPAVVVATGEASPGAGEAALAALAALALLRPVDELEARVRALEQMRQADD
jgi:hypothetical protein